MVDRGVNPSSPPLSPRAMDRAAALGGRRSPHQTIAAGPAWPYVPVEPPARGKGSHETTHPRNGIAGLTAARAASERDRSIDVAVFSEEHYPYYSRPLLVELVGDVSSRTDRRLLAAVVRSAGHRERAGAARRGAAPGGAPGRVRRWRRGALRPPRVATGAHAWMPPSWGPTCPAFTRCAPWRMGWSSATRRGRPGRPTGGALVLGGGLLGLEIAAHLTGAAFR
jgi:hypothetical protein